MRNKAQVIRLVDEVQSIECDLCHKEFKENWHSWGKKSGYGLLLTEDITIEYITGFSFYEDRSYTRYEMDMCPDCFKYKLVPWIKSQGGNIRVEES